MALQGSDMAGAVRGSAGGFAGILGLEVWNRGAGKNAEFARKRGERLGLAGVLRDVLFDLLRFAEKLALKEEREIGVRTERGSTIIIPG